jgi:peptide chain release factor 1
MKPFLRSQLERYAQRHGELDFLLSREDIMSDMSQFLKLSREHAEVTVIAGRYARLLQRESDLAAAREMLADPDMADMAQEEIASAEAELSQLEAELQRLLLPRDPDDKRNAFLEIRAGTGGDESACLPPTCCACTPATPNARAGKPKSSANRRANSAATRRW